MSRDGKIRKINNPARSGLDYTRKKHRLATSGLNVRRQATSRSSGSFAIKRYLRAQSESSGIRWSSPVTRWHSLMPHQAAQFPALSSANSKHRSPCALSSLNSSKNISQSLMALVGGLITRNPRTSLFQYYFTMLQHPQHPSPLTHSLARAPLVVVARKTTTNPPSTFHIEFNSQLALFYYFKSKFCNLIRARN